MALTRPRAYQIYDIDYKQAVRVVTVADITLSGGAPNSVDGVNLSLNDRILVTGQTSGVQNGIYYVTTVGSGANGTWTRSIDTDTTGELLSGTIVMVTEGNNYADTQWKLTTNDPITIGVTSLTFVQNYSTSSISSGNSNVVVAANSSVTISSAGAANVIKVDATNISVTANIVPTANVTYSLGTATARFKDIYLANNSIYLGNLTISGDSTQLTVNGANVVTSIGDAISISGNITSGNILTSGLVSATGNVTGSYIIGNGSQLTGLPAGYANSDVANLLASFGSNTISTTGNVTSGNLLTSGVVSATGNITSAANVSGGNVLTSGLISATGNITTTGAININSTDGNYNVFNISGTALAPYGTPQTWKFFTNNIALGSSGSWILFPDSSTQTTAYPGTATSLSLSGNVTGGNLLTSGLLSVTGNITSAANISGANIIATTIVSGSSLLGSIVSASANVTGGNVLTSGIVSSTGNITSSANVSGGNLVTTGNVNGGNLNATTWVTSKDVSATGNAYINGFVSVVGNLYVANVISQGNLSVEDPLLYLTANTPYPYNYDIGFFSQFQTSPGDQTQANGYQHTGFVRDQTDSVWKLFSNVVPDPTATVNFNNAIYDPILTGAVSAVGNVTSTANIAGGNLLITTTVSAASHIGSVVSVSANITGGNLLTGGLVSATGNVSSAANVAGGNLLATTIVSGASHIGSIVSVSSNITGGNIFTVGQISATGTITTAAGNSSTGFAVGNGAVSNVGLGFFPTAGTRGDYAIRDYSSVFTTMYLDAGMGGSAGGEFQFRSSNAFSLVMRANTTGVYSPGIMSATGIVYGSELNATNSQVNEGGQINLALPSSGSTLSTSVILDVYQNRFRIFEGGGTARGAYIDLTSCGAGASTNLLAGAGGTPGGSNTNVQFNDGGTFGGNGQFTYDKVTNTLTAGIIAANNNGAGTNFKVGDDIWIGDVNIADTMRLTGQQNGANAYIVFGNADGAQLGRAGTGPLTYAGAFSASGNITGGNIISSAILSVAGRTFVASGNSSAPGITFLSDTGQDTGFYWISDGNIGVTTNGTLRVTFDNAGNVSATGNITGGNILTSGIISAASHIGSVVSVSANITGGNILTGGVISATGNITATANIAGGNILTGGLISATGNITGNYFIGNGSQLTGISGGSSFVYTANTAPPASGNTVGAQWYNTSTGALYEYQSDGTSTYWVDITGPTVANTVTSTGDSLSPFLLMGA